MQFLIIESYRYYNLYATLWTITTNNNNNDDSIYVACENLADCNPVIIPWQLHTVTMTTAHSGPVIIPYMVVNRRFIILCGIITGSLSANYSWAVYSKLWWLYINFMCSVCVPYHIPNLNVAREYRAFLYDQLSP